MDGKLESESAAEWIWDDGLEEDEVAVDGREAMGREEADEGLVPLVEVGEVDRLGAFGGNHVRSGMSRVSLVSYSVRYVFTSQPLHARDSLRHALLLVLLSLLTFFLEEAPDPLASSLPALRFLLSSTASFQTLTMDFARAAIELQGNVTGWSKGGLMSGWPVKKKERVAVGPGPRRARKERQGGG